MQTRGLVLHQAVVAKDRLDLPGQLQPLLVFRRTDAESCRFRLALRQQRCGEFPFGADLEKTDHTGQVLNATGSSESGERCTKLALGSPLTTKKV